MARMPSRYVCQQCGAEHPKWAGRCEACGAWNAIVEEAAPAGTAGAGTAGHVMAPEGLGGSAERPRRLETGIKELDRSLGGGLVPGSAVLVAGDPGIGKSTLLLQAAAALAAEAGALYVSGEEATDQIRMRAERLHLGAAPLRLLAATSIDDITATLMAMAPAERPGLLVIDSIQTMQVGALDSAPGSVSQVRGAAQALISLAKATGLAVVLVGHVTKEGQIAGPRVLEHMVDTVLYFEGERGHEFRILRAVKNRFGPTDEIGVFEMGDGGLSEVANPSLLFIGAGGDEETARPAPVPGAAVFAGIEGTRPILVEIQALVTPSSLSAPRRAVVGWDTARLAMVIAVLDARCGLALGACDVYLSVAGGLRIGEPAADLAVAAALVSSLAGTPAPPQTVFFGEVRLSGEVRAVSGYEARLKEAEKLGFTSAVVPPAPRRGATAKTGLECMALGRIGELLDLFSYAPGRRQTGQARSGPERVL